jgi:acetyl esterase/lipase
MSTLDLFAPAGTPERLVLFVHGGSWVGGDKSNLADAEPLVPWLEERGYVVAAPNFRLASDLTGPLLVDWEDQLTDVAAALATSTELAGALGVDEPGVLLIGYSSGAHLVAMLGADARFVRDAGLPDDVVAGTVSLDVHAYDVPVALDLMVGSDLAPNIPLIEHLFGTTPEAQLAGSPVTWIDDGPVAPALLVSAEPSDRVGSHGAISSETGALYAQRLVDAGHVGEHVHFDDETHTSLVLDLGEPTDGPTQALTTFLDDLGL